MACKKGIGGRQGDEGDVRRPRANGARKRCPEVEDTANFLLHLMRMGCLGVELKAIFYSDGESVVI
jgi:hypothetical protein